MDAVCGAWLRAKGAKETFTVINSKAQQLSVLGIRWIDDAGRFIDAPNARFVDVNAIHRAGFGAQVAGDALLSLKLVDASVTGGGGETLLGVLNRCGLLKAV